MKCKWNTSALSASALLAIWPIECALAQGAKDVPAGAAKAAIQAKVTELKQSLATHQKALHQYTWVETTEISLKGEVKKDRKE